MSQPLKKQQIIGMFGEKAGQKLYNFLTGCCDSDLGCCPSEKYTITATILECDPVKSTVSLRLDLTANEAISNPVSFTYWILSSAGGSWSNSVVQTLAPDGLAAGETITLASPIVAENLTMTYHAIDSRGNWSNFEEIAVGSC